MSTAKPGPKEDIEIGISSPTGGTSFPLGGTMNANGTFIVNSENPPTIQYQLFSTADIGAPVWRAVTSVTMNPAPSTSGRWSLTGAALPATGANWELSVQLILSGQTSPSASAGVSGPLTGS